MLSPASFLRAFKAGTIQQKFALSCKALVVLWLAGVYIPLNLVWDHQELYERPWQITFSNLDFSQYYLAGAAARYGMWNHLYPKLKPEWVNKPGARIYLSSCSDMDPELLAKVSGLPADYGENISPPPEALLCLPLAFFPFSVALKLWMTALTLAMLGTLICAVEIYRRLGGGSGYFEGAFFLFGGLIPLMPRFGGGDNVLMFLALCGGVVALSWVKERPLMLASCLIIPAVFKGMSVTWCPLLLLNKPIKGQTIAWLAAGTILLNGVALGLGGTEPYTTWARDILPKAQDMDLQQYWHHNMNLKGIAYNWGWTSFPVGALSVLQLAGLAAVYYGFWKQRESRGPAALATICAASAVLLVIFNLCNAISWLPYISFFVPFVGWAVREYELSSAVEKMLLYGLAALVLVLMPLLHVAIARFIFKYHENPNDIWRDIQFGIELLFLFLGYRRLFFAPAVHASESTQAIALNPLTISADRSGASR